MKSFWTVAPVMLLIAGCGGDDSSLGSNVGSISCDPNPDTGDDCRHYCDANDCSAEENFTQASLCQEVEGGAGVCLCSCGNFNGGGGGGPNGSGGGAGFPGFGGSGGPEISKECDPNDGFAEANCFLYCDKVPCRGGQSFVIDSMCAPQIGGGHECECECGSI